MLLTGHSDERTWWAPWLITMDGPPLRNALVRFDRGLVQHVEGDVTSPPAGATCFHGCVIAPGFVNAHTHIEYAAYENITDGLPFADWIGDHVQRKRRLSPDHMAASALLGAWQCASSGITFVADASFSGDAAWALQDVGLRGRVYLEVFGVEREETELAKTLARLAQLPSGLIAGGLSPHAPYTASRRLYELVASSGLPWMTHLSESVHELELAVEGSGPLAESLERQRGIPGYSLGERPITALAHLLSERTVVVHAVHTTTHELELIANSRASVAHCPRSNARLGCGVMNLPAMHGAGVTVGLGTDSPASAGSLDMFAEMRCAIEQQRAASGSATALDAERVLRMATVDAAAALHLDDTGVIKVGSHADLVACRIAQTEDPVREYVLGGSPPQIAEVVVAGSTVWKDGSDKLAAAREAAAEARHLLVQPVPTHQPA